MQDAAGGFCISGDRLACRSLRAAQGFGWELRGSYLDIVTDCWTACRFPLLFLLLLRFPLSHWYWATYMRCCHLLQHSAHGGARLTVLGGCWRAYVGGMPSRTHCARNPAARRLCADRIVPPLVAGLYMGLRSSVCFLLPSCMTYA